MVEIKEVLRLWRAGTKKKRIAAQLTLDVKTVRRYVGAAESCGVAPGLEALSDEQVATVVAALSPDTGRPHGDGWERCAAERDAIKALLDERVRLSKIRRLLHRRSVDVPYSTLHRFAVAELGFGQRGPTIPVVDGKPGEEAHVLLEELAEAQLAGERKLYVERLSTVPLLIIDDLGMRKLPATAAEDLLEIVLRRYERASTMLTSNRPVEDWGKLLGDAAVAGVNLMHPVTTTTSPHRPPSGDLGSWASFG